MDPNNQGGEQLGPNGRRLHIAHRRTPSEMTPLMSTFNPFCGSDESSFMELVLTLHLLLSGTTRPRSADRDAASATAADRSNAPAIC